MASKFKRESSWTWTAFMLLQVDVDSDGDFDVLVDVDGEYEYEEQVKQSTGRFFNSPPPPQFRTEMKKGQWPNQRISGVKNFMEQ